MEIIPEENHAQQYWYLRFYYIIFQYADQAYICELVQKCFIL